MLQVVSIGVLLSSDVKLSVLLLVVVGDGVFWPSCSSFTFAVSGALVVEGVTKLAKALSQ